MNTSNAEKPLVFGTSSGLPFVGQFIATGRYARGRLTRKRFPDGERYQRLRNQVMSRDVVVVGDTATDASALEVFDLACAIVKYGARSVTVLIQKFEDRCSCDNADILSALPQARNGTHVMQTDFYNGNVPELHFAPKVPREKLVVFHTVNYGYLAKQIARRSSFFYEGSTKVAKLPVSGSIVHENQTAVAGEDVILVGGTVSDEDTMELYRLARTLVKQGARTLTMVVPYYGYSTMERAVKSGEVVTAKTRARLLSSIPPAQEGNRIALMDLHSEGIPHYFEGSIGAYHIYCEKVILRTIKRFARGRNCAVGSADGSRSKWVQTYADKLGIGDRSAFIIKRRISGSKTKVMKVLADVEGRIVFLFDDMVRTGGSAKGAAEAYLKAGAAGVILICTHGVLPGESLNSLAASGLFERIIVTDTHPRAHELAGDKLTVVSVAGLIASQLTSGLKL
jgi:ribose-phosphate pyrophosphokinase